MTDALLEQKIKKIISDHQIGTMATVAQNRPYSRYMTFFADQFILYTATAKQTHKVEDIEENPYVHLIIGFTFDGTHDEYVEIEGQCSIHDDPSIKKKLWNKELEPWFSGVDDPNYLVLKITPQAIHLKNDHQQKSNTYNLS
ncbi:pyridoxamine 5'-phosphate oxidase family protein [Amphibacillus sediminis]|uniref:pyridoxamine 5'-phosphate oxidase family protein n=1 Tax=Amphibacillus sediminis TaxID=360185 RepID=UPI00082B1412|nr:pyridoxamine 5'-phosphate oxidase family protein [Amphibacillus sediminis]